MEQDFFSMINELIPPEKTLKPGESKKERDKKTTIKSYRKLLFRILKIDTKKDYEQKLLKYSGLLPENILNIIRYLLPKYQLGL